MEYNQYFEANLNLISCNEHLSQSEEVYKMEYETLVTHLLSNERLYLFEEDIVSLYNNLTLQEILADNQNYVPGSYSPNPKKEGKRCRVYYDTWMALDIEPRHLFYDHFFAYLLKHTDLMKVDACLTYQFEKYHDSNFPYFSRFMTLLIRKFKDRILQPDKILTIQEWITSREQQQKAQQEELSGSDRYKARPRIRRRAGDNETVLDQRQTVILIHYMQEKNIFLSDSYLTDADAGKAFELLTGYSQHTIRQDLGQYRELINKENLKKLKQVLAGVTTLIDNHLTGKESIT